MESTNVAQYVKPPIPSSPNLDVDNEISEKITPQRPPMPKIKSHSTLNSSLLYGIKQKISKKLEETAHTFQQNHPDSTFGAKLDQISKHLSASINQESKDLSISSEEIQMPHEAKLLGSPAKSGAVMGSGLKKETPKYSFTAIYNKSQDKIISSAIVKEDIEQNLDDKYSDNVSKILENPEINNPFKMRGLILPQKDKTFKVKNGVDTEDSKPNNIDIGKEAFQDTDSSSQTQTNDSNMKYDSIKAAGNRLNIIQINNHEEDIRCHCLFWHGFQLPQSIKLLCNYLFGLPPPVFNNAHCVVSLKETIKTYLIFALSILLLSSLIAYAKFNHIPMGYLALTGYLLNFTFLKFIFLTLSFLLGVVLTLLAVYLYDTTFGTCPSRGNIIQSTKLSPNKYQVPPDYTSIEPSLGVKGTPSNPPPQRPPTSPICTAVTRGVRTSRDDSYKSDRGSDGSSSESRGKYKTTQSGSSLPIPGHLHQHNNNKEPFNKLEPIRTKKRSVSPPDGSIKDDADINYKSYQPIIPKTVTETDNITSNYGQRKERSTFRIQTHQVWMNELPMKYVFETYRVQQTRTVLVKLDGSILKISIPKQKLPKRHLWNEKGNNPHSMQYANHRIYDITGSSVYLLPGDMPKKVYWNKKYPICLKLKSFALNLYTSQNCKYQEEETKIIQNNTESLIDPEKSCNLPKVQIIEQSDQSPSITPEIELYLFARANREKEEWFWKLLRASCPVETRKANSLASRFCRDNRVLGGLFPLSGLDPKSSTAYWIKDDISLTTTNNIKPLMNHDLNTQTNTNEILLPPTSIYSKDGQKLRVTGPGKRIRTSRSSSPLNRKTSDSFSDESEQLTQGRASINASTTRKTALGAALTDLPALKEVSTSKINEGIFFDPYLYVDSQNLRTFLSPLIFGSLDKPPKKFKWSEKFRMGGSKRSKSPDRETVKTRSQVQQDDLLTSKSTQNVPTTSQPIATIGNTSLPLATKSETTTSLKSQLMAAKDKISTKYQATPLPSIDEKKHVKKIKKIHHKHLTKTENASSEEDRSSGGESYEDQNMPITDLIDFDCTIYMHPELCWLNALMERLTWDVFNRHFLDPKIELKIKRKLTKVKLPYFIEPLKLVNFSTGSTLPTIHLSTRPWADERGIWWEFLVYYNNTQQSDHNLNSAANNSEAPSSLSASNLQTAALTNKKLVSNNTTDSIVKLPYDNSSVNDKLTSSANLTSLSNNDASPSGPQITLSTKINLMKLKAKMPKNIDTDALILAQNILEDNPELVEQIAKYPKLFKRRRTWSVKGSESEDTPESSTEEDEPQTSAHKSGGDKKGYASQPYRPISPTLSPMKKRPSSSLLESQASSNADEYNPSELQLTDFEQKVVSAQENKGKKILKMVDKIASSKYFQQATDMKYIKKGMEAVSNTPIILTVELHKLEGIVLFNLPNPPSDRLWYGFRPKPDLRVSAKPKLGAKNVNISHLVDWIRNTLLSEFDKFLVVPNMDDIVIPVMNSGQITTKPYNK